MGNQEAYLTLDASTRTRILTTSSESSINPNDAFRVESKKRKRDDTTMGNLLDDAFTVKPYPSSVFTKPQSLLPIALLSRSQLPLSSIELFSNTGPLPAARLFEAHVKVLELEHRLENTPMVLIARAEDGKSYYAIEREARNIYVVCKLGIWVILDQLCTTAILSRHYPLRSISNSTERGYTTHGSIGESDVTPESSKYSKKKRLAIEAIQSMVRRPSKEQSSTLREIAVQPSPSDPIPELRLQEKVNVRMVEDDMSIQPMADTILDNIRSQYFEALYLSKASLAYFAKGPLSRARAAFHLDYDSTLDMNDLIAFLKGLVLPTNVVDKKYKDAMPELVLNLLMGDGTADEAQKASRNSKRAKPKKMKPGKNGLYPVEDTYIRRWWESYDASSETSAPGESKEDVLRKRVAQLRIRETQLQLIVILETLALQPLATSQTDQNWGLPSNRLDHSLVDSKTSAYNRSKKLLDLSLLVEVHVDRLCIWQSVAAEEGTSSRTEEESKAGANSNSTMKTHAHVADVLREFCVEVIVPFFSARLPEQCTAISRKLSGLVGISPAQKKTATSTISLTASSKPGAIIKRPVPAKARRSLQRVLTDERHKRGGSGGASSTISLMRSATAPAVPGLKREESETRLLSSIPMAETQSSLVSRGSVLKSKKFSKREVDLSSLVPGSGTRTKKLNIEAELKDAISALKRPNRQLAGQLQVEMAEKRTASTSASSRKSKKSLRDSSFQGVQILSTPKGNRHNKMAVNTPPALALKIAQNTEVEAIPPSSLPRIPLSVVRSTNAGAYERTPLCQETPARIADGSKPASLIQDTPSHGQTVISSRRSSKSASLGSESHGGLSLNSPLQSRQAKKNKFLNIPSPQMQTAGSIPSKLTAAQATPVKSVTTNVIEEVASSGFLIVKSQSRDTRDNSTMDGACSPISRTRDSSIYKTLGWDDYDDIE